MGQMDKGIACRICANNKEGKCVRGNADPVQRKDDCWTFQDRRRNSGLADHAEVGRDW